MHGIHANLTSAWQHACVSNWNYHAKGANTHTHFFFIVVVIVAILYFPYRKFYWKTTKIRNTSQLCARHVIGDSLISLCEFMRDCKRHWRHWHRHRNSSGLIRSCQEYGFSFFLGGTRRVYSIFVYVIISQKFSFYSQCKFQQSQLVASNVPKTRLSIFFYEYLHN